MTSVQENQTGPDGGLTDEERKASLLAMAEDFATVADKVRSSAVHLAAEHVPDRYPQIDWATFWQRVNEPVRWLCEPLIEAGRSVAFYSPAKTGKSLLWEEIAACLATGRAVLGNAPQLPVDVVYVDLENTVDDVRERLSDMGYGPADDLSRLHYLSFPSLPALDSPEGGKHLLAIAQHYGAALVIIDTVSRVVAGEENAADTFRSLYRHAIMPLKAQGIAVLRLDHSGKDVSAGQRGSSASVDDVDAVWKMTLRPGGSLDLHRTHSRNNHGAGHLVLTRLADPLRHRAADEALPADIAAVVRDLDELKVDSTFGREKCRSALLEAGRRCGNDVLALAVAHRKSRPDLSADRSDTTDLWNTPEDATDRSEEDV